MSSNNPKAYVFSSVYIGDCAPASGVLSKVNNIRTEGVLIGDTTPTEYISWLDEICVTGDRVITVESSFYSKDSNNLPGLMAKGISVGGSFNDITDLQMYTLLLVAPDETLEDSFYFPKVKTNLDWKNSYKKDGGIVTPVTFTLNLNDPFTQPYFKSTVSALVSLLGTRSPI